MRLLLLSGSLATRVAGEAPVQGVKDVEVVAQEAGVKGAGQMGKKRPLVGDRLLTVGEVAATMRVSNMTVYRLIKSGQLAAIRVGKNYRIRESEIDRYLSERSVRTED
jgi:excisionase family DNA binding protein